MTITPLMIGIAVYFALTVLAYMFIRGATRS